MSLAVTFPAMLADIAELGGARSALHWIILKEMWSGGRTWAARDEGGRLVGLFGLYALGDGSAEAWFNVRPDAGRHGLSMVRQARLTLPAQHYPEIVTICVSEEGKRIAAAVGFVFSETCAIGEIWKWTH